MNARPVSREWTQAAARLEQRVAVVTVLVPLLGAAAGGALAWRSGHLRPLDLALCLGLGALTILGVTVGYHRLFTHRSFEAAPAVRWLLGALGSMSAQGPLVFWAAVHRLHHQESDRSGDPHSPNLQRGSVVGLWHAHVGWMLRPQVVSWMRYAPDLLKDRTAFAIHMRYPMLVLSGLALPALIGGLATGTVEGAVTAFLWGGLARVLLVHHVTWSVNSICHVIGERRFRSNDRSTNNWVFGLLAFGEGWHNNHHAFPWSARHGLAWWQLDVSYMVIRALEIAGLAWNVKRPSPASLAQKRCFGASADMEADREHS
ncbi:acyl-CoA desaturase [Sorangium sp. So ce269]